MNEIPNLEEQPPLADSTATPTPPLTPPPPPRRLTRSRTQRMLGGVAGGVAEYFGLDVALVRLGFVLVALLPGPAFVIYLAAWIIVPEEVEER